MKTLLQIQEPHHRRKQHTKQELFPRPPRTKKTDYSLKPCTSTDDGDETLFDDQDDKSLHSTGKCNNQQRTDTEGHSDSSDLHTHEQQEKIDVFPEIFDPRTECLVVTSPQNHVVVERGMQLVPICFDCHLEEVANAPDEQFSDG